jgi:hypothetical protein
MDEYLHALEGRIAEPLGRRLTPEVSDLAWRYAYRFFFEYPFEFPWHLVRFWDDVAERPFGSVLTAEAWPSYARTLRALAGEPVDWHLKAGAHG